MKSDESLLLKAVYQVAQTAKFENPNYAYWQCSDFSNAVVSLADDLGFDWKLYSTEVKFPADTNYLDNTDAKDLAGTIQGHTVLLINNKIYDFTLRQFIPDSKYPYITNKTDLIYQNGHEIQKNFNENAKFWKDKLLDRLNLLLG